MSDRFIRFPSGMHEAADAWDSRDIKVAKAALARISPQRVADFDQIRLIGRILHSVSDSLYDDWRSWASAHPGYTPEKCREVWASFANSSAKPVGLGLLIKFVREDAAREAPHVR